MITVEIVGLDEAVNRLDRLQRRASSDRTYQVVLGNAMEVLRRYAVAISPVDTGAYQGSHRIAVRGKEARLYIDPAATNPRSGQPVTRYAGPVEDRYRVYGQVEDLARGMRSAIVRELTREITR